MFEHEKQQTNKIFFILLQFNEMEWLYNFHFTDVCINI